jgi:hypothetical protein
VTTPTSGTATDIPEFDRDTRRISIDGEEWIARLAGGGAAGSGAFGLAMIESIEFATVVAPGATVREALVQRGCFAMLHDSELVSLFHAAPPPARRRSLEDMN